MNEIMNINSENEIFNYLENLFENVITDIEKTNIQPGFEVVLKFDFKISKENYNLTFGKILGTTFSLGNTFKLCKRNDKNEEQIIFDIQTKNDKATFFVKKLNLILSKNLLLRKYAFLNCFEKIEKIDNNVFLLHYSSSKNIMLYKEQILIGNDIKITPKALFNVANAEQVIKHINEVEYEKLIAMLEIHNDIINTNLQLSESELLNLLDFKF